MDVSSLQLTLLAFPETLLLPKTGVHRDKDVEKRTTIMTPIYPRQLHPREEGEGQASCASNIPSQVPGHQSSDVLTCSLLARPYAWHAMVWLLPLCQSSCPGPVTNRPKALPHLTLLSDQGLAF